MDSTDESVARPAARAGGRAHNDAMVSFMLNDEHEDLRATVRDFAASVVAPVGGDYFAFCLALHELARVDSSVAITLEAGVALGAMPIHKFGSPAQQARWLPELCRGERLAAFGLTESGGGSDIPGGMRTTARLTDD